MGSNDYANEEVTLPTSMVKDNILINRIKKGYKQAYVANQLGITEKAYRNIEQGNTKKIQVDRLQKIATIFGLSDWHELTKQKESISQVLTAENNSNYNSQSVNFFPNEAFFIHEKEILQMKLQQAESEKIFLKDKVGFLEREIENLKHIISLMNK